MRIALAQQNYHIGNFKANKAKILEAIAKAKEAGADLILFSELSVCGYYPNDLLERLEFIEESLQTIREIATHCKGIAALVGGPSINPGQKGKMLYNSAFFLRDGAIESVHHKTLLPTYDVFDEYRHFESNKEFHLIELKGKKIAVTLCEDIWFNQKVMSAFGRENLYEISPMEEYSALQPDLVVNLSASPFSHSQELMRKEILIDNAKKYNLPIVYVNQVGAQTELIFDGGSLWVDREGQIVEEMNYFEEDFLVIEPFAPHTVTTGIVLGDKIAKIHDALVTGIRDYFQKINCRDAIVGLSGGIDSAVTLVLAVRALGAGHVKSILMPSQYSSDHSVNDAASLAINLGSGYEIIPIKDIFYSFEGALHPLFAGLKPDLTEENLQARIRGTLLMTYSNKFGGIVLNTSNKSEAAVGYGTLYGDMNGGLSVLGDVYKTDVYQLARYINRDREIIPLNTIQKPPSAELRPDQKDSDSLPEYDLLDAILTGYIDQARSISDLIEDGFDEAVVRKVARLVNFNEYKRFQTPPILRVSSKAFGFGRKMPIVAVYPD